MIPFDLTEEVSFIQVLKLAPKGSKTELIGSGSPSKALRYAAHTHPREMKTDFLLGLAANSLREFIIPVEGVKQQTTSN